MFEIQYEFSESDNNQFELSTKDESAFRYDLFLGSIFFIKEDVSILMDWDWVPLLDFAICLSNIQSKLMVSTNKEEFEFTESDYKILFAKERDRLVVTTTFSNEIIKMSITDFIDGVDKFYKSVFSDVLKRYPILKSNKFFLTYSKSV